MVITKIMSISELYSEEIGLESSFHVEPLFYEAHLDPVLNIAVQDVLNYQNLTKTQQFYARVIVRIDDEKPLLNWAHISLCSQIGSVYTGCVEVKNLHALAQLPGVIYVENGGESLLGYSLKQSFLISFMYKHRIESSYTSMPMRPIIGIIDSKIDVYDRMLRKSNLSEPRFLFIWDQTDQQGRSPSEISNSYGVEYDEMDFNNAKLRSKIHQVDSSFDHGTLVAKIIAQYMPNPIHGDMIAVKTNGEKSAVIDAIYYIINKARQLKRPVVINLSLGSESGPHDGSSNFELAISEAIADGQLIVVSGGNDSTSQKHAEISNGSINNRKGIILPFLIERKQREVNNTQGKVCLEMWVKETICESVTVVTPDDKQYGPVGFRKGYVFISDNGKISVCNTLSFPPNGDNQIIIVLEDKDKRYLKPGIWQVILNVEQPSKTWECDAWLGTEEPYHTRFLDYVDPTETITSPSTSIGVICVGVGLPERTNHSYVLSNGPTRDGRPKPDIWSLSQSSTSFASAEITAIIANLLTKTPNLNVTEAIEILKKTLAKEK